MILDSHTVRPTPTVESNSPGAPVVLDQLVRQFGTTEHLTASRSPSRPVSSSRCLVLRAAARPPRCESWPGLKSPTAAPCTCAVKTSRECPRNVATWNGVSELFAFSQHDRS